MTTQPEALRLADELETIHAGAAAELRRLHAESESDAIIIAYHEATIKRDTTLLRQALEALEILRTGLIQMREHSESYGEAWARAYVKEYRGLIPFSAEEQFRALNAMQHRLSDVADSVVKGFDAIAAIRQHLEGKQ